MAAVWLLFLLADLLACSNNLVITRTPESSVSQPVRHGPLVGHSAVLVGHGVRTKIC